MTNHLYEKFFKNFHPRSVSIEGLNMINNSNLIMYGEIHGASENADIVYNLCRKLEIQCLAIEYSEDINEFITRAVNGKVDFTLLDNEMFDKSILSIEMVKTIVLLLKNGNIKKLQFLDSYFDKYATISENFNPENRELTIAEKILVLNSSVRTLCILGNWHTRPSRTAKHISAYLRVREKKPDVILIYNKYRQGSINNMGEKITLPLNINFPQRYAILSKPKNVFDLIVPEAHPIKIYK